MQLELATLLYEGGRYLPARLHVACYVGWNVIVYTRREVTRQSHDHESASATFGMALSQLQHAGVGVILIT